MSEYESQKYKYTAAVKKALDSPPKGKNNLYTSLNGHMFTFLDREGFVSVRFSKEDQEAFMKKHDARESIQYGAVMRGYAIVPQDIVDDQEALSKLIKQSHDYIATLPPK